MSSLATRFRTHTCGELRAAHAHGKVEAAARPAGALDDVDVTHRPTARGAATVTLCGHVDARDGDRAVYVRDRYGRTLVEVAPRALPYVAHRFSKLNPEDVVQVTGRVAMRPESERQSGEPTGDVKVAVTRIEVLSTATPLPENFRETPKLSVDDRLNFRQLYLRRPEVQARMELRHRVTQAAREWLVAQDFLDVETPQLFWYDPVAIGGETIPAGNGRAWRLPSGPVVLDQYVNAGQFERTFQLTRITRREDKPTPFHQQEHTGLDVCLSYVDTVDFCRAIEGLLAHIWRTVRGREIATPFKTLTFAEAILRYGTDRIDARFGLEIQELQGAVAGQVVRAFRVPGGAAKLDELAIMEIVKAAGAGSTIGWASMDAQGALNGPAAAAVASKPEFSKNLEIVPGDFIFISASPIADAAALAAGAMRLAVGGRLGLIDKEKDQFVWVTDYPFLERDERGNLVPRVVVFAAPSAGEDKMTTDPANRERIRARAFDLMLNGQEIGSAYIGNHSLFLQRVIWFNIFKLATGDLYRVRAPIESHRFGMPPHGGITIGFDRLVAVMAGTREIDEVMAYPKSTLCRDPMLGAPGPVPLDAVKDLLEERAKPAFGPTDLAEEIAAT